MHTIMNTSVPFELGRQFCFERAYNPFSPMWPSLLCHSSREESYSKLIYWKASTTFTKVMLQPSLSIIYYQIQMKIETCLAFLDTRLHSRIFPTSTLFYQQPTICLYFSCSEHQNHQSNRCKKVFCWYDMTWCTYADSPICIAISDMKHGLLSTETELSCPQDIVMFSLFLHFLLSSLLCILRRCCLESPFSS